MLKPGSPKDSLREKIELILASKRLKLYQVSKLSKALYGSGSEYFIPHNFYYELGRGSFTPSIYQIAALSRITGYRLEHWFAIFGVNLESIPRLQTLMPAKRTVLIDSSVTSTTEGRVLSFHDKQADRLPVAPLSQLLANAEHKWTKNISGHFLYAKIGYEDALAFPKLFPGSLVGVDPEGALDHVPDRNEISSRIFLVEHSKGLFCCRLRRTSANALVPVSEKLPYAQIELEYPSEVKILGMASLEIRFLVAATHAEVPADLARRWAPNELIPDRGLGRLLRERRRNLKLSLQAASGLSREVAAGMADERYFLSPSFLSDREASDAPPRHVHKIVSLCAIYGIPFWEFAERIGIVRAQGGNKALPRQVGPATELPQNASREPVGAGNRGFSPQRFTAVPDVPSFLRDTIAGLSRIPEPSLEDFFWIKGETNPLHPSLKDGIIAMVNRRKKRPIYHRAKSIWEQSIYLLLLRGGDYICASCSQEDQTLVLHPYPQQVYGAAGFRVHEDAEVAGQIVAIVRKLM